MTSTLPPLIQAFSGAIGSASANSLVYPLDLVTTRLQTSRSKYSGLSRAIYILHSIIDKHGWLALYDGLDTDTAATLLSNFFYFYFYTLLRSLRPSPKSPSASKSPSATASKNILSELALGFIAGVASRAVSTPLNIITFRLQTQRDDGDDEDREKKVRLEGERETRRYTGIAGVVKRIYEEEGLRGFWRGFETTILLSLNPSLTFFFFQLFRYLTRISTPRPGQAFIGAAISNSIAVTLLYPLILSKTRLQASRSSSPSLASTSAPQTQTIHSILHSAYHTHGFSGLYQGLEAQLVKGCLSQGVTFLVKARIEQAVVRAYLRRRGRR